MRHGKDKESTSVLNPKSHIPYPISLCSLNLTSLIPLLLFLAVFTLYLMTGAPGCLFGDGGMLLARVLEIDFAGQYGLALAHPLYIALGALGLKIVPGDAALRLNQFSALLSAVTIVLLFVVIQGWTGRNFPALAGALSLALSWTFWRTAGGAEVYPLVLCLLSLEWLSASRALHGHPRSFFWLGLAGGLGLSTHPFALISTTVWALVLLRHTRNCLAPHSSPLAPFLRSPHAAPRTPQSTSSTMSDVPCLRSSSDTRRLLSRYDRPSQSAIRNSIFTPWLSGLLLGSLPLISLFFQQYWQGHPAGTLLGSFFHGDRFATAVWNPWPTRQMLVEAPLFLAYSFPLPLLFLIPAGWKAFRRSHPELALAGLLQFLFFFVFAFRYPVADRFMFFLPAWLLLSCGLGLAASRVSRPLWQASALACILLCPLLLYANTPWIMAGLGLKIPVSRTIPERDELRWFLVPWGRDDAPGRFAHRVVDPLPRNGVLYADNTTIWPLYHLQCGGLRPDIRLVSNDRVFSRGKAWNDQLQELEDAARNHRLYTVTDNPSYSPLSQEAGWRFIPFGPVWKTIFTPTLN